LPGALKLRLGPEVVEKEQRRTRRTTAEGGDLDELFAADDLEHEPAQGLRFERIDRAIGRHADDLVLRHERQTAILRKQIDELLGPWTANAKGHCCSPLDRFAGSESAYQRVLSQAAASPHAPTTRIDFEAFLAVV
jgi:hypothetical protein